MSKFSSGDVVRLKSGGPNMTVNYQSTGNNKYWCDWIDGNQPHGGDYEEDQLVAVADRKAFISIAACNNPATGVAGAQVEAVFATKPEAEAFAQANAPQQWNTTEKGHTLNCVRTLHEVDIPY